MTMKKVPCFVFNGHIEVPAKAVTNVEFMALCEEYGQPTGKVCEIDVEEWGLEG